jgi:DNA-binding Lrp family transcriptional regulator
MTSSRSTVRDLRRSNRERLIRQLYFDAPISRLDLSQRLGLSPATVTHAVAEFLNDGLIVESGVEESEGGRPRTLLTINAAYGYMIVVDVGETDIQLEIFDLTLRKLRLIRRPVSSSAAQPEQVVQQISEGIAELIASSGVEPQQILGIGVGMPGIVDVSSGVSVFAPNWGWRQIPFLELLSAMVLLELGFAAQAHHAQRCRHGAFPWSQDRPKQQDFGPFPDLFTEREFAVAQHESSEAGYARFIPS